MSLQVLYTPRAKETLSSVYNFINTNFGIKTADKFVLKTEKIITLISKHPFMLKPLHLTKLLGSG